MSTSFRNIDDFRVTFQGHTADEEIFTNMNRLYSDALPDPDRLFIDPATKTELKPNTDLLSEIKQMIAEDLIAPHAIDTPNPVLTITPFITAAALFVEINGGQRRLSKQTLTKAMEVALSKNRDKVDIRVNVSHLHADHSTGPVTMLDWRKITTNVPTTTQTTTLTAADIAAAVAGAVPAPMSAAALATALANAFTTINHIPAPTVSSGGPAPTPTPATTLPIFNSNSLPADIKIRYDNKMKKGLVLGSDVKTHYSNGYRYYMDTINNFILADGTLFISVPDPNEKAIMKATIYCEDDSHAGIRSWYQNFVQACHDYGYYAHPLWCFLPDHGGDRGFSIGDDPDDDLPRRFEVPIAKMTHTIFRLLSKKDMFPKHSRLPAIIRACDGDGYRALKAILFKSHPAFHDQPATLITTYPKQRDATILEYWKLFLDFQQLRAYIADIAATLDDDTEMDVFLRNAKYSDFLNRVTRDERRLYSNKHKYTGSQLVETLDKFLMAPDSPAVKAATTARYRDKYTYNSAEKENSTHRQYRNSQTALINPVHIAPDHDSDNDSRSSSNQTVPDSDDDDHSATMALYSISVPHNPRSREVYHVYCAAIHRLSANPQVANNNDCIVCGGKHRFDACDVLNNTDFLRGHYVRFCQQLRRDTLAKAAAFSPSGTTHKQRTIKQPPKDKMPIHFIDDDAPPDDTDYDTDADFQRGRV